MTDYIKYAPRVKETTATTGTGSYALAGPVVAYQDFSSGIAVGNYTTYCCANETDWEVGVGKVGGTTGAYTLSRDHIVASSNSNLAVSWPAGDKSIYCVFPPNLLQAIGGGTYGNVDQSDPLPIGGDHSIFFGSDILMSGHDCIGIGYGHRIGSDVYSFMPIGFNVANLFNATSNSLAIGGSTAGGNKGEAQVFVAASSLHTTLVGPTAMPAKLLPMANKTASVFYDIMVNAFNDGAAGGTAGDTKAWSLKCLVRFADVGGTITATLIGSVDKTVIAASGASSWDANVTVSSGVASIQATGEYSSSIHWSAFVRGLETSLGYSG